MPIGDAGVVTDCPYDEAIPLDDSDDDVSTPPSSEAGTPQRSPARGAAPPGKAAPEPKQARARNAGDSSSDSGSETSSSTSESDGAGASGTREVNAGVADSVGAYNPDDWKGMRVSAEVEELFQYITRYKPHTIDLETVLKPNIPELIPSIGEVDAFLKMPSPDGKATELGTVVLDEPTLNPTDPSILDLQLRSVCKHQDLQPLEVRSIENAEKNPKEVDNWVKRISELNRTKPAPVVQYSRRMPDIEQLMQVWPAELEEFLQQNALPEFSEMDLDTSDYIKVVASILDVPVYSQITETLHVIFTLYSEFKTNQHFSKTDGAGMDDPYNFGLVPNFADQMYVADAPSRAPSPCPPGVRGGYGGE